MNSAPILHLRGASFGYGEIAVVREVDLDVRPGEVIALLGPNGSGKSTLVRGLLGLADHLGGVAEVFGAPLGSNGQHTSIGYVPQRHSLSASVRATVTEVVSTGRLPLRPWWRPGTRSDADHTRSAIEAVGLGDRARAEVAALSGGQQRRVLIARALAGESEVLVMDEPTAGVDRASQEVLATVLARLKAAGTTMLIVTHELTALEGVVSRIVCLDRGVVDFDGDPTAYGEHLAGHPVGGHHHDEDTEHAFASRATVPLAGTAPLDPTPRRRHE
ncbi:MAG: metal ABC transporter ATP-binding protein [Tetrasphaera sp.]|nr:metal ABC transporter ATP-binding protein [Tetrasphaera sp.]